FAFGFITLLFTRVRDLKDEFKDKATSMVQEIKEAFAFVWSIPAVRLALMGIAAFELLYRAPILVGMPVLAKERFAEGALVYGLEMGAWGAGAFIGGFVGGTMKAFDETKLVRNLFLIFAYSGATLGMMVLYEPYEWAMFVFFTAGLGDGMIWVLFLVWLQNITPEALLGRVMGLYMFMTIGLLPIANILMGMVAEINIELSLLAISAIMVIICLFAAFHPDGKRLDVIEK
ncbi:MAG: MFS transporter, partial [Rhodospirillaceae bacterium]|nr:MFS transporter [Rhodospirillaceae bacterium]